jgi:hypothetical protein
MLDARFAGTQFRHLRRARFLPDDTGMRTIRRMWIKDNKNRGFAHIAVQETRATSVAATSTFPRDIKDSLANRRHEPRVADRLPECREGRSSPPAAFTNGRARPRGER